MMRRTGCFGYHEAMTPSTACSITHRNKSILWVLLLFVFLVAGCNSTSDEAQIKANITAMEAGIQARNNGDVMTHVADDFIGNDAMDAQALRRYLTAHLLRHQTIGVTLGPKTITLQGDTATAEFTAVLTGGSGGLLPEEASKYRIQTGWRKVGSDWQMISASWSK